MLSLTKKQPPYKNLRALTKDNVMHLGEQRGCAVLRIASAWCNHHCWHLLPTTEMYRRRNPRKTTNKVCVKWCYSTITRPHFANLTKNIQELDWEVIPHPPYSPDLAPPDFHLFRSLSNNLQGTSLADKNVLRAWLEDFNWKPRDFYRRGFEKLHQRCQTVVNSEGE